MSLCMRRAMSGEVFVVLLGVVLWPGCAANRDGLLAQAEGDLRCAEDNLNASETRAPTTDDGAGARYEVEGCGKHAEYEKKAPFVWQRIDQPESKRGADTPPAGSAEPE
jgi:hypothetical protein